MNLAEKLLASVPEVDTSKCVSEFTGRYIDDVPVRRKDPQSESCALIANMKGEGTVLEFDGASIYGYIEGIGHRLGDLGLDDAPEGLSIWEGTICSWRDSQTGEYDSEADGKFRPLTVEEYARMAAQHGIPWEVEMCEDGVDYEGATGESLVDSDLDND